MTPSTEENNKCFAFIMNLIFFVTVQHARDFVQVTRMR
jgi:hypothetical protein